MYRFIKPQQIGAWWEDSATTGVNSTPDEGASASGAAYIFQFDGTAWTEKSYIKASNTGVDDYFGDEISLNGDGNTLAIGAPPEDSATVGINSTPDEGASASGAVYLY